MNPEAFDPGEIDIAWCPGCGNFAILDSLKEALAELEIPPEKLAVVSGIGQAAKIPQYLRCNYFNGLHGRALPAAAGIKAANRELTVIAESGDGDMYGEGGNHFIHAIRRNPDITNIVHNNMVYGLTKGQASPTSQIGFKTAVQVDGVSEEPFNPLAVAIALDAPFVARVLASDEAGMKRIIKMAVRHEGYALVDVLQPCVTFNRVNTYQWFKENTYRLGDDHDPGDRAAALARAIAPGPLPVGVIYRRTGRAVFERELAAYRHRAEPLHKREPDISLLEEALKNSA